MLIEASCCNLLSSSSFLLFFFPLLRSICFASTRRFLVYPPIFLVPSLYSFIVFVFSVLIFLEACPFSFSKSRYDVYESSRFDVCGGKT